MDDTLTCPECGNEYTRYKVDINRSDEPILRYTTGFSGSVVSAIKGRSAREFAFPCGHTVLGVSQ